MRYLILIISMLFMSVNTAQAQNVSSPSIDAGKLSMNNRVVFSERDGDGSWDFKPRFEYGLNDRWAITWAGEFEKQDGSAADMDKAEFRAMYLLTDENAFAETALRGVYDIHLSGEADSLGLEYIARKKMGDWRYQFNLDTAHEVGEKAESGLEMDLAFGAYKSFDGFRIGPEYYVDFGRIKDMSGYSDQEHQFGPAIVFDVPVMAQLMGVEEVKMEAAYFAGISHAAEDHTIKYELDIAF